MKIDRTAPNTTVTAPPAWNKSDVTLTLVPNDGLSGVDKTFYQLDGGAADRRHQRAGHRRGQPHPDVLEHRRRRQHRGRAHGQLRHRQDLADHRSHPEPGRQRRRLEQRRTSPSRSPAPTRCPASRAAPARRRSPPRARPRPSPAPCTDNAGNTATDPAAVSIDKTKPVITVDALPAPNANGWYGDDVTATYTASDALSGIKTQDTAHTFGEGADQTDTATATDAAGNSASVTTPAVNVDKTAPTITGKVVGTPNGQRLVHRRRHRPLDLRRQPVRRRRLPGRLRRHG